MLGAHEKKAFGANRHERPTRAERKKETFESLKKAALHCFAEQGLRETQVGDVSRRARVAHGTFYVHFEDKEVLIDEIFADMNHRMTVVVGRALRPLGRDPDASRVLRRLSLAVFKFVDEEPLFGEIFAYKFGVARGKAMASGLNPRLAGIVARALKTAASSDLRGDSRVDSKKALWVAHGLLALWVRLAFQVAGGSEAEKAKMRRLLEEMTRGCLIGAFPSLRRLFAEAGRE